MESVEKNVLYSLEDAPSCPVSAPSLSFGVNEQKDAALLAKVLLKRAGLATTVLCAPRRLSITLSGMPSDLGSTGIVNICSVVMAVGHTLKDIYNVGSDFVLSIDFWAKGRMATTVGKVMAFSRKMKTGPVPPEEFWEAFDFLIGSRSSVQR